MNRIYERNNSEVALTPVSLATSTDSTPIYIECSNYNKVDFIITHGALTSGKKVTVGVYVADDATGTNATKIGEAVSIASGAVTNGALVASAEIAGNRRGFYGIKVSHNNASEVVVAGSLIGECKYGG